VKQDLERYLEEARGWEASKVASAERSKKIAWIIAGVAVGVAVVSAFAAAALATREVPPPDVLAYNLATGTVDQLKPLKGGDTTYDEVINKYWTEQYIIKREGFLRQRADEDYIAVGLMSGGTEKRAYADWFSPKNAQSPLNVYGEGTRVRINIVSTTFIKPNLALTRFQRLVDRPGQAKPETTYWAATVGFKYVGAPMKDSERRVNPLGYQVTTYRVDPDAASDVNSSAQSAAATPAAQQTAAPAQPGGSVVLFPGQVVPAVGAQQAPKAQ
jgi:type IV secretion system protein VirB8